MSDTSFSFKTKVLAPMEEWGFHFSGWSIHRIRGGLGYVIDKSGPKNLNENDFLISPGSNQFVFRASQMGGMQLEYFVFYPDHLSGLLTMAERDFLYGRLSTDLWPLRMYSSNCNEAKQLQTLFDQYKTLNSLSSRCALLLWIASVVESQLARLVAASHVSGNDLYDKFNEVMDSLPDAELESRSMDEIARLCGCSRRHFQRRFQEKFGMTLRQKANKLRLDHAKRLLESTNEKILTIALETGFNNLSFFNRMFKHHFGMTPSLFRLKVKSKSPSASVRTMAAVVLGLLMLGQQGFSQTNMPSPGLSQGGGTSELTIDITTYEVAGNTLLTPEEVAGVLTNFLGDKLTKKQVFLARDTLALTYRKKGWMTATVVVPPQKITNGVIHLKVLEGKLSEINIVGNDYYSSNNIMRALPSLRTNLLLNGQWFGPELDRANANSDRQIYPKIMEGVEPGTSALKLEIKDRLPLHGRIEANNQGTPGTPPIRLNGSLQYNNLWQRDHSIGVQYGFTPVDFKEQNPLPGHFYDHPLIANYSAYYRLPIGQASSLGDRWEQNPASFGYDEVSRQFKLPPMSGRTELTAFASRSTTDTGTKITERKLITDVSQTIKPYTQDSGQDLTENADLGFRLNKSLPEMGKIRSSLSGGLDYKLYHLTSFNTNLFIIESKIPKEGRNPNSDNPDDFEFSTTTTEKSQPTRNADVNYLPLSWRWDGYRRDKYGSTTLGLGYSLNIAGTLSDRNDFAAISGSQKTTGTYHVLTGDFSRDQKLINEWSVLVRAGGQWANEPLISNEQYGIGGTTGVRGYEEGERYGDSGWKVLMEPKTPVIELGLVDSKWPMRVQGSIFTDYGESYRSDKSLGNWRQQLWGAGFGLSGGVGQFLDFRFTLGWPLIDAPNTRAGTALAYFTVGAQF